MHLLRLAVAATVLFAALAGTASAAPLTWSSPSLVDRFQNFATPNEVRALACAGDALCMAVGWNGTEPGGVSVSTTPTDPSKPWSVPQYPLNGDEFEGLECPSTSLCVGMTTASAVWVTKNPGAAVPAWTKVREQPVPNGAPIEQQLAHLAVELSCPTTTFCASIDRAGHVTVSTNPGAASPTWTRSAAPVLAAPSGVADLECPSAALCVALDENNVTTSTSPAAGPWAAPAAIAGGRAVSCATTTSCMIAASGGALHRSTDPAANQWTALPTQDGHNFVDIACPTTAGCSALTIAGTLLTTTNAGDPAPTWRVRTLVLPGGGLGQVVCGTPSFCVAARNTSTAVVTNAASPSPAPTWSPAVTVSGVNVLTEADCPSESLCVVADNAGRLLSTPDPTAPAPAWRMVKPFNASVVGLSCPTPSVCLAVAGNAVRQTRNAGAAVPTWSGPLPDPGAIRDIDCPTADRCVVIEATEAASLIDLGVVPVLDGPQGPDFTGEHTVDGAAGLSSLTCPTTTHCAAIDAGQDIITTPDVTAADPVWTKKTGLSFALSELTCPSTQLCVAVDFLGRSWTSSNAFAATPDWNGPILTIGSLVDCPTSAFCLASDGNGARTTDTPTAAIPSWSAPVLVNPTSSVGAIACANDRLCLTADREGRVAFGVAAPQSLTGPAVSGTPAVGTTLTAAGGTWTGVPATTLQWERCSAAGDGCAAIDGATGASYAVGPADIGQRLRVNERATNAGGATSAASATTDLVPAPPVPPAGTPPATPPPAAPSIGSLLRTFTAVGGAGAKLGTLVRTGRYTARFNAPAAGRLLVRWSTIPKRGRKAVLLASGRLTVTTAGRRRVVIRLTKAGKRIMRRAKRLPVRIRATWTPRVGRPASFTRTVTLKR